MSFSKQIRLSRRPLFRCCASLCFSLGTAGLVGCGGGGTYTPPTTSASATLSAMSLNFQNVNTGTLSLGQSVTLTNTGNSVLTVSSVAVTGDYLLISDDCGPTVVVGGMCQVTIQFKPTIAGVRSGTLNFTTNASGSPQSVALTGTGVTPVVINGTSFAVSVLAGTRPIAGASLKFYAAGVTGNGIGATSLLSVLPSTDATGSATIPMNYSCSSRTSLVYLIATGGAVGASPSANPNIALMTAIGSCGKISPSTKVVINEATTVAAMYSLAQFYGPGGLIGSTASNLMGLTNAFATAASLTEVSTGVSPGSTLPGNAVSPAPRINAVANALNVCTASANACAALFGATSSNITPTNTLDALFNLVKNPAANVSSIYAQSLSSNAFRPTLTSVPSDWTMFVNYSGGGLNNPSGIGVDSGGNVWVANYFGVASKFTPTGGAVFPGGVTGAGLNNSYGLAIDLNDKAWIPNEQPFTNQGIGSVSVLTPAGTSAAGPNGYQAGGLNYPISVAIDADGTVWVVDYGNSHVTLLDPSGNPLSGTNGYTTPLFAFPVAVAVDGNHFGWIANQSGTTVTRVSPDGQSFTNYDCCMGASGVAIDQGNNVWVANFYGDSVSLISSNGAVLSKGAYTGSGAIFRPQAIAVDGSGNVWVANYRQSYLVELAGATSASVGRAISPSKGYGSDAALLEAYALALDASGNIWVSNQGSNTVTKFIGLGTPVKTPLSALPRLP